MDDVFGQINCKSSADSIVMKILRSAMDKAHEKVQSKDGPIEFLHERSTFYELAAILVEGGLNIVQEEMDILEGSCDKILSDLIEIREWLHGRIQDMKRLIVEKDRELIQISANESKLRQALELKERELVNMYEKLEPERLKNGTPKGDISELKSSVDQQVWSIKQKLEDEEKSRPNQNILIRRMSSDIDILKETLDLAFGRMQRAEVLPLEKQWRWGIEKDVESIMVKGFISHIRLSFDVDMSRKVGFLKGNWFECLNQNQTFHHDVHEKPPNMQANSDFFTVLTRANSEPLPDIMSGDKLEVDTKFGRRNYVAKMVKSRESNIRKHNLECNWLTREVLERKGCASLSEKHEENNGLENVRALEKADNLLERNCDFDNRTDEHDDKEKRIIIPMPDKKIKHTLSYAEKLEEEIDGLYLQITLMEDTYRLLFQGIVKDISSELCFIDPEILTKSDGVDVEKSSFRERIEHQLKGDVYAIFLKEMAEAWKLEKEFYALESHIKDDIYQLIFIEAMRDLQESEAKKLDCLQERTTQSRIPAGVHNFQEGTPRFNKFESESLTRKLCSLVKCLEAEEDLMLRASSEIKEHSENHDLVISNCEEMDERNAIEWLLNEDESTLNSVGDKLGKALRQLYTSKELLVDLEQSLEVSDDLGDGCCPVEQSNNTANDKGDQKNNPYDEVLSPIIQFQQVLGNVERTVHENLESKCFRLEELNRRVGEIIKPVSHIRTRKLVYKKAFNLKCHNLKLAESEVDLLGDQVEALLCLLERIYIELNQHAVVLYIYAWEKMWLPNSNGRTAIGNGGRNGLVALAIDKDKASQHALKWAIANLLKKGQTIILIHVIRRSSSSAVQVLGNTNCTNGATSANYQALDHQTKELLLTFHCFCARKDIQCFDVVLEDTEIAKGITEYIAHAAIESMVLGASRHGFIKRLKMVDIPTCVSKAAPDFCTVYVISKTKISTVRNASRLAPFTSPLKIQIQQMQEQAYCPDLHPKRMPSMKARRTASKIADTDMFRSPFLRGKGYTVKLLGELTESDTDISFISSDRPSTDRMSSVFSEGIDSGRTSRVSTSSESSFGSIRSGAKGSDYGSFTDFSMSSVESDDVESEMKRLKLELQKTMDMYSTACREALTAKQKAVELRQWRIEEERRLEEARIADGAARLVAEQERAMYKEALEKAQAAQRVAEMESKKRVDAEMKALQEVERNEKAMAISTLRYRRYTIEEIEEATEYFANSCKIGEGGYGPVYKCYLDHTPVAVKVLRPDAAQGRSQFQQEVEVLSCMRHPNLVLLLGACPEYGCLVYEYMGHGSLDDCLFRAGANGGALSWPLRFKISAEIATGLHFLHQMKPEPLVHRDLKPGNILLDQNYVSKIGDVGLARLVPSNAAEDVTQYRITSTAGTFSYIDPEYQQTGMLGVKSDVYSLGIVLLQMLTAKPAMGLAHQASQAIEKGTLADMLDSSVPDWPLEEALSLAKLAVQCAELRRKDRPDLGKVVLQELNKLREFAEQNMGQFLVPKRETTAPCPNHFSTSKNVVSKLQVTLSLNYHILFKKHSN
ncbi:U-box domain-containing protein 52-like [Dorcoceras hygrometricum]|uniref:RING-type E3 ubiquitin transferase n=1 Tax=Dorcoceras hygrometricum TaxID=472368 RepID=A0A2Z7CIM1_9LAMI|nr:U-box domain-containing protein 52-like [Dorcoceras hygrometricum]